MPGNADCSLMRNQPASLPGKDPTPNAAWTPVLRLWALAAGVFLMITTDRWSESLAVPVLLCSLPLVLHTALLLPRAWPFALRHPYVIGWIYGVSRWRRPLGC